MTEHPDKLLIDLLSLADWLSLHAARHPDQQTRDGASIRAVGQAIGRIEGLTNKQPEIAQVLVALRATLEKMEKAMSQISDQLKAFEASVNTSFDTLGTAVDGLTTDVQTLNDDIKALQDSTGTMTPEDQAILDRIDARAKGIADKAKALDDLTEAPPVPPT